MAETSVVSFPRGKKATQKHLDSTRGRRVPGATARATAAGGAAAAEAAATATGAAGAGTMTTVIGAGAAADTAGAMMTDVAMTGTTIEATTAATNETGGVVLI